MPRASSRPTDAIEEARHSLANSRVMLVGIGDYDYLTRLDGPHADVGFINDLLTVGGSSIFKANRVASHLDLTCEEFRKVILDYSVGRSAKGDILILYFSGHGCVIRGSEFGYCLKDTRLDNDGINPLPISVVPFSDIIRTLELYDVYPVIIIDACYSGMAVNEVQNELELKVSLPHAVISSSSYTSTSIDQPQGGPFTETMLDILLTGLRKGEGSLWPYYTIQHLEGPLRTELNRRGLPVFQLSISTGLPRIPLVRNKEFSPRIERFTPQYKGIVLMLWNEGNPRAMDPNDFREKLGTGATNNHSKLSLKPWRLLVDGTKKNTRVLSSKGKKFVKGTQTIPRIIFIDPESNEWKPVPKTERVRIDDIGDPTWK